MKILKIWGIPIYKMLSDTEFIERVRKGLRFSRKLVWIHAAMLLIVCVFVPMMVNMVWQITKDSPNETRLWIGAGLLFGFLFGVFIGQYLINGMHAILSVLDLFDYNRAPRLLIKYHDLLKEIDVIGQDDEQQDESGSLRTE